MKKWNLLLVLVLSLALSLTFIGCDDDDDDDDGPTGPTETFEDMMVGTWFSGGDDVAPLLIQLQIDSVRVTFNDDNTVDLDQHITGGAWVSNTGTWGIVESDGDIHEFTATYDNPSFTQEGIIMIDESEDPDMMQLEVVQTNPDIGAEVPTVDGGFGSTAIGDINVQTYRKQ
ncbi:hypothetical protein KQI52_05845 [bacterium]|nr:hypothetical protein [bacterium]